MGRGTTSGGVEIREASIRVLFSYRGKQRKETLYLDNAPLPPTPANVKYARRVASEIRERIRAGEFVYSDYFPHSPMATSQDNDSAMLFKVMDRWLKLLDLKASTKKQYGKRIESFWKAHLKNVPVERVRHSDILEALKKGTWASGKSRNNELSMIRQVFEFARKDGLIKANPCSEIERASYQSPGPDPFSMEEVDLVLADIKTHCHEQILNFTQFMFFTGLRTNEGIGLRWADIDFVRGEMKIDGGMVYEEETDSTKTSTARKVKFTSRALEALKRQKAHTFLAGGHVFHDPKTGEQWAYQKMTDVRSYWSAIFKRTGIRYRRPYNTRHTYATVCLMAGANPAYIAKQLGHSTQMLFRVYADWINGADNDREMQKIEASIRGIIPELTQEDAK
jgi:integrase